MCYLVQPLNFNDKNHLLLASTQSATGLLTIYRDKHIQEDITSIVGVPWDRNGDATPVAVRHAGNGDAITVAVAYYNEMGYQFDCDQDEEEAPDSTTAAGAIKQQGWWSWK